MVLEGLPKSRDKATASSPCRVSGVRPGLDVAFLRPSGPFQAQENQADSNSTLLIHFSHCSSRLGLPKLRSPFRRSNLSCEMGQGASITTNTVTSRTILTRNVS